MPEIGRKRGYDEISGDPQSRDVPMEDSPPPQEPMDVDVNDEPFSEDEEAKEDRGINDEEEREGSEGSGEDLMENMEQDYKEVKELDQYEG